VVPRAFLVTCSQGKEAVAISNAVVLIRNAMDEVEPTLEESATLPPPEAAGASVGAGGAAVPAATCGSAEAPEADEEDPEEDGDDAEGAEGKAPEDTWVCDAGCNGVVCVTIEKKGIDPVDVLARMWDQLERLKGDTNIKARPAARGPTAPRPVRRPWRAPCARRSGRAGA